MGSGYSSNNYQKFVYIDFEATTAQGRGGIYQYPAQNPEFISEGIKKKCKDAKVSNVNMQEPIELGMYYNGKKFSMMFMPRVNSTLDPFVTELTTITQDDVNGNKTFTEAFKDGTISKAIKDTFDIDVNDDTVLFVCCGDWDYRYLLTGQFINDGYVSNDELPVVWTRVCNIKEMFKEACKQNSGLQDKHKVALDNSKNNKKRRMQMTTMLEAIGEPLDGTHHRADDDAMNVAKIGQVLLDNDMEFRDTFTINLKD